MVTRMKAIKYISFVGACVLLVGCATTFRPWKLSEVQEGMERSQVVAILGEPDRVETKNGEEFLYYSYSENYSTPPSDNSLQAYVDDREPRSQPIREYIYSVTLVEGKVLSYAEIQE